VKDDRRRRSTSITSVILETRTDLYEFPPIEKRLADIDPQWKVSTNPNVDESEVLATQNRDFCAYHTQRFGLATKPGDWIRVARKIVKEAKPGPDEPTSSTKSTNNDKDALTCEKCQLVIFKPAITADLKEAATVLATSDCKHVFHAACTVEIEAQFWQDSHATSEQQIAQTQALVAKLQAELTSTKTQLAKTKSLYQLALSKANENRSRSRSTTPARNADDASVILSTAANVLSVQSDNTNQPGTSTSSPASYAAAAAIQPDFENIQRPIHEYRPPLKSTQGQKLPTGNIQKSFAPNPTIRGRAPTPTYNPQQQMLQHQMPPPRLPRGISPGNIRMSKANQQRAAAAQQQMAPNANVNLAAARPDQVPPHVSVMDQVPQYDDQGKLIPPALHVPTTEKRSIYRTQQTKSRSKLERERKGPFAQTKREHDRFFRRYAIKATTLYPFFPLQFYPCRYTLLATFHNQAANGVYTAVAAQDVLMMGDGYIWGMIQYMLRLRQNMLQALHPGLYRRDLSIVDLIDCLTKLKNLPPRVMYSIGNWDMFNGMSPANIRENSAELLRLMRK
ncbi:unnamed protein product, partial [Allacma fusca]